MIKVSLYKYGFKICRKFNSHGGNNVYITDYFSVSKNCKSKRCMGIEGMPGYYSCIPLSDKDNTLLIYEYCQYLVPVDMEKGLILGGAGGTVTRYLLKKFPYALIDVVEICEFYILLSKKYFLKVLQNDKRLYYYNMNAEDYLNFCVGCHHYDFIFCDLFDKNMVIDLVFKADFQKSIRALLSVKGVLVINLGIITAQKVKVFLNIMNSLYPYIELFKFDNAYVMVLSKSDLQSICDINLLSRKKNFYR